MKSYLLIYTILFLDVDALLRSYSPNSQTNIAEYKTESFFQKHFPFDGLTFDSRFASGHLDSVEQIDRDRFEITIGTDPAPKPTNQLRGWFYFRVQGARERRRLSISIANFRSSAAALSHGISLVYKSNQKTDNVWKILEKELQLEAVPRATRLTFEYDLEFGEVVRFALTLPYTEKRLSAFLSNLERRAAAFSHIYFNREVLTRTSLGTPIELIRLSSMKGLNCQTVPMIEGLFPERAEHTAVPEFNAAKCAIVFTARAHSAESAGSFMLEGLLTRLLDSAETASTRHLLDTCVIYVVPMLNPDGVRLGLTRTDVNGVNLNNAYNQIENVPPTVEAVKKFIAYIEGTRGLHFYADFHNHMQERGFFLIGLPINKNVDRGQMIFPTVLQEFEPQLRIESQFYATEKYGSSRTYFSQTTKTPAIYTVETNYWGPQKPIGDPDISEKLQITDFWHFYTRHDFLRFGSNFLEALKRVNGANKPELRKKWLARADAHIANFECDNNK